MSSEVGERLNSTELNTFLCLGQCPDCGRVIAQPGQYLTGSYPLLCPNMICGSAFAIPLGGIVGLTIDPNWSVFRLTRKAPLLLAMSYFDDDGKFVTVTSPQPTPPSAPPTFWDRLTWKDPFE